MKKAQFSETINAPSKLVYETMLGLNDIKTYQKWTAAFNPTSTYDGSWEKGGKIYFIGTDENGKRQGMIAEIAENIPNKFVSIRHYGILDGEKEITSGEHVDEWAGAHENYTFQEDNAKTKVTVEMDIAEEYVDSFNKTWPKALTALKEIIEGEK